MDTEFIRNNLVGEPNKRIPEYVAYTINKYLLDTAKLLRLPEWTIVVNDDEPTNDVTASTRSRVGTKFAGMWFSDRFLDPDDPSLNDWMRTQVLIHELLHLHFEEAWEFIDELLENEFVRQSENIASNVFKNKMEVGVDQLAWALAEFLPKFVFPRPQIDIADYLREEK